MSLLAGGCSELGVRASAAAILGRRGESPATGIDEIAGPGFKEGVSAEDLVQSPMGIGRVELMGISAPASVNLQRGNTILKEIASR
jgi:hypothetical protein